jgi:transcriptional regulator GlxA family with amidase domain/YHS domain-containing protein
VTDRSITRRKMLQTSAALGCIATAPFSWEVRADAEEPKKSSGVANPLKPPADGPIPVAFLISEGAVLIDFVGPWEVFSNLMLRGRMDFFKLYTVSETSKAIRASGGMKIVPDYTIETAPPPKVIVIPAQSNQNEPVLNWVRQASKNTDVTMSVCTGAFLLAATGLLSGKSATTHHGAYVDLATQYPDVHVQRGMRFVEDGKFSSAGGLSSGIDLAFRVVERYFGRDAAEQLAYDMEYQGQGWMHADSNQLYAKLRTSAGDKHFCPICGMEVDPKTAPTSVYKETKYYFCMQSHKANFDAAPQKYV